MLSNLVSLVDEEGVIFEFRREKGVLPITGH